jgi:curved DNA-binding protein CbpA
VFGLPEHYESLEIDSKASPEEIERAYQKRVAELRASRMEEAPEDLAEVEAAHAVLSDPAQRAAFDESVRRAEEEEDKKNVELDAFLQQAAHRRRWSAKGSSGLFDVFDAIWAALKFFK